MLTSGQQKLSLFQNFSKFLVMPAFFDIGIPCQDHWLFDVPHLSEPIKYKRLARKFPAFVAEFDGSTSDCFLSFYYKLNKERGVFEFKSAEDEDEVADLLGVSVKITEIENEEKEPETKTLTKEEVAEFREHMKDIRQGLEELERSSGSVKSKGKAE